MYPENRGGGSEQQVSQTLHRCCCRYVVFYVLFPKYLFYEIPKLKLLKMKQHAQRKPEGDGVECFREGRQGHGDRELRKAWEVKV